MSNMKWIEVNDESALKVLISMGAPIKRITLARVPGSWGGEAHQGEYTKTTLNRKMPSGDVWFKADDCATLGLLKQHPREGSDREVVYEAIKVAFERGDMKLVLSRKEITRRVLVLHPELGPTRVRNAITWIYKLGGLRRAGREKTGS